MELRKIFAQLGCAGFDTSLAWYTALFGRGPDARPMDGLAEWHHGTQAGFQLFLDPEGAGRGTLTLFVAGLSAERARLDHAGIPGGAVEEGDVAAISRLRDPDGNLVVLVEARD